VNILIVHPGGTELHTGNRTTAERWALLLRELGHQVQLANDWSGSDQAGSYSLLVALHARRGFAAIDRFHRARPEVPIVVALTGTDLYRDIENSPEARQSLEIATRLIVLQPLAMEALPPHLRERCRVVFQSAEAAEDAEPADANVFCVCVLSHLRGVKDPLRAAYAARDLPADSRVQVLHAGGALDPELVHEAEAEQRRNPRYRWLGALPRERALRLLAGSQLLALTSYLEGGANVISEAIAAEVPVVSALIPGSVGLLGAGYPGYFEAGDTRGLRLLMERAETDTNFYGELKGLVRTLKPLFDPGRERESWRALLSEVSGSG
jgi:putative glycosyltransferase (TIGR04348 family)